jgi:signal peptidase I
VTGAIWGAYVLFNKMKNKPNDAATAEQITDTESTKAGKKERTEPLLVEFSRFLFPVFFIVLIVRGFLVEPFQIPSGSMLSTLEAGDYILVNKFSYGLRSPLGYYKLVDLGSPERGDVIVFRYPENPEIDYIKRVVGLPGDVVTYKDKTIYVNGELVDLQPLGRYTKDPRYQEFKEKLGDVTHNVLHLPGVNRVASREFVVPEESYFVLGDNRDNSRDSRFWGFVPDENLKGRAFMIWMHKKQDEWPSQWHRIGTIIE